MIPRVLWPVIPGDKSSSPFVRSQAGRPIRLTFHSASLSTAEGEEFQALELLRELANLNEVEAIDTVPGSLPHMTVGAYSIDRFLFPVTVRDDGRHILRHVAVEVSRDEMDRLGSQGVLEDIVIERASCSLDCDLLVTLSSHLLTKRDGARVRSANPRTPLEAVKIVGLLLRSRGSYVVLASPSGQVLYGRGMFYSTLVEHKLPHMHRYFYSCLRAQATRQDDVADLASSVVVRCTRALEARDEIGAQFFLSQDNNTRDVIMYHFDYLTLLLVGALDAQARIARRALGITRPKNREVSFRKKEFRDSLMKVGATELYNFVSEQRFSAITTLLHELRNTIHGSSLPTVAENRGIAPQNSLVALSKEHEAEILEAAQSCGPLERWGITQGRETLFEPYTYAMTLVDECFVNIDTIAKLTDLSGLFPAGSAILSPPEVVPDDYLFCEAARHRIALLG